MSFLCICRTSAAAVLCLSICFTSYNAYTAELDPPHDSANSGIGCDTCHDMTAFDQPNLISNDSFIPDPANIDWTLYNSVCWVCHMNPLTVPPEAYIDNTHSSRQATDKYGTWTVECIVCHNQHTQEQAGNQFIRSRIYLEKILDNAPPMGATVADKSGYKDILYNGRTGANSFADGDTIYDGICEVCHTKTTYFRNDGSAVDQNHSGRHGTDCVTCHNHQNGFIHGGGSGGSNCIECHGHDAGYEYSPGLFSQGAGTTQSHSTHTENDIDDQKGPNISCSICHDTSDYPYFAAGNDLNGNGKFELNETFVCDYCHSPGGNYDGINDPDFGAKNNWSAGVYSGNSLRTGKELWCAACHDDTPANSKFDGTGVPAVNITDRLAGIIGDTNRYGFYNVGHGRSNQVVCTDCHSPAKPHIDHVFTSVTTPLSHNDYRFIPGKTPDRNGATASPLCFSCHVESWLQDTASAAPDMETNFRQDNSTPHNLHYYHVYQYTEVSTDDRPCSFCHDPHGTPYSRMTSKGMGKFSNLRQGRDDADPDPKYFMLEDAARWDDPVTNKGGGLIDIPYNNTDLRCYACHMWRDNIVNGVGPTEEYVWGSNNLVGWYLRTYKPKSYEISSDNDGDGIPDIQDNCWNIINPLQENLDNDHLGDACDSCPADPDNDIDGDSFCGDIDLCPTTYNTDNSPVDSDGDSIPNGCDNCPSDNNPGQEDIDGDTIGDACDPVCNEPVTLLKNITVGTDKDDFIHAVTRDSNNNFYVVGHVRGSFPGFTNDAGTLNIIVIKYDADLTPIWYQQIGNATHDHYGLDIAVDGNGNVFVLGKTYMCCSSDSIIVYKLDPDGIVIDESEFGAVPGSDYPKGIALDSVGNIYVTGYTTGDLDGSYSTLTGEDGDIFLAKLDPAMNLEWVRMDGGNLWQKAYDVTVDNTGNIYVTGYNYYMGDINLKYDSNGNQIWRKSFSKATANSDYGYGIVVDNAGYVYVAGETPRDFDGDAGTDAIPGKKWVGNVDTYIVKYDQNTDTVLWTYQLGSTTIDRAYSLDLGTDGNLYMTGYTVGELEDTVGNSNPEGDESIFVASFDSTTGNKLWSEQYTPPLLPLARGWGISVDSNSNAVIVGDTITSGYPNNGIIIKVRKECP